MTWSPPDDARPGPPAGIVRVAEDAGERLRGRQFRRTLALLLSHVDQLVVSSGLVSVWVDSSDVSGVLLASSSMASVRRLAGIPEGR